MSRRIGSGAEVTLQTALYYNGLLKLLIEHQNNIETKEFEDAHEITLETLGKENKTIEAKLTPGALFSARDKGIINVGDFLNSLPQCEICGGYYYPGLFTQYDHIEERRKGGLTIPDNGRNTHPFCNHSRIKIEKLKENKTLVTLPAFEQTKDKYDDPQLKLAFLDDESDIHDEEVFEFDADAEE